MHYPEQEIRLRSSARTSIGQVRENNEDNIHLWTHDNFVLAIVADGMGGAAAGEEASRIAVEAIKAGFALREQRSDSLEDSVVTERLRQAIHAANISIVQKAAASPEMKGMGTTVTLAFVRGTYAIVAHVGDSRAYLVDGEDRTITQITSDHSFVEALLVAGHITPEQAEDHPMKNVLYRALGQAEDIDVDMYYKRLHVGDRLILCSDGLTRHVKPDEIAKLAMADPNPDIISQNLIDMANARGGEDNVSVIVVSVESTAASRPTQAEAVLTTPLDDDDTLVLKDRYAMRSMIMNNEHQPPPTPQKSSEPDLEADTPTPDARLEAFKMRAERLKDDGGDTTLLFDDDSTEDSYPILDEEFDERLIESAPDLPDSGVPQREHTGEGRDTLIPEQ